MAQVSNWFPLPTQQGQSWRMQIHETTHILKLHHKGKPKKPHGGVLTVSGVYDYLSYTQFGMAAWRRAWRDGGAQFWEYAGPYVPGDWVSVDRSDWHNFAATYQYKPPKGDPRTISGYKWFIFANQAAAGVYQWDPYGYWSTPFYFSGIKSPRPTVDPASIAITSATFGPDPGGRTTVNVQPPRLTCPHWGTPYGNCGGIVTFCLPGFPKNRDRDIPNYWFGGLVQSDDGYFGEPGTLWNLHQQTGAHAFETSYPCRLRFGFRYVDTIYPGNNYGGGLFGTPGPLFIADCPSFTLNE